MDLGPWHIEIDRHFEQEIEFHFAAEEQVLFPVARRFPELVSMVDELITEHGRLRKYFTQAKARALDAAELGKFAKLLSGHIRKEERRLFEALQRVLSPEELAAMGEALERALQAAVRACGLNSSSSGTTTFG
jgi:hemerythrin-like domain-containing protein